MNYIVYLITFPERRIKNEMPFYYIGSKSEASFRDGVIYKKDGKEYWGSSQCPIFVDCLTKDVKYAEILYSCDNFADMIQKEREIHVANDVVANPNFFNRGIAGENNFSDNSYASYRHTITGKNVRLPRNHISVLDGTYVGASSGFKHYHMGEQSSTFLEGHQPEGWILGRPERHILRGEKNPFHGKTHSVETKAAIIENRNKTYENDPALYEKVKSLQSARAKALFQGVPKTPESNAKRARPGMVVLKNKNTGETVRVYRDESQKYDPDIWKNPYSLREHLLVICPHCKKELSDNSSTRRWHFDNCKMNPNKEIK